VPIAKVGTDLSDDNDAEEDEEDNKADEVDEAVPIAMTEPCFITSPVGYKVVLDVDNDEKVKVKVNVKVKFLPRFAFGPIDIPPEVAGIFDQALQSSKSVLGHP